MADYSRGYEGAGYGRRYDEDDDRYGRGGRWRGAREDRGFWERAGDEVRSWFGDEEAERRRMRDDREYGREYGRGYGRGYGREGYRQGSRGDYERGYGERGYGEYGRGVSGYGREGYGGDYESGYGRESYGGDYGQGDYGREGYGQGYYGREAGRRGRYGMSRQGGEYGYGDRGLEYGRSGQYGDYGERGYSRGSDYGRGYGAEYGYEQGYSSPYWSYTEMWFVPGPYTGRGPSGYRRSDDRITEDINERLQQHGQIDASNISVNVNNGEVTLSGTVESRLEKRLAEDVAESCSGVREVHNNLRVRGREQERQSQYGQQTTSTQSQYGTQSEPRSRYTTG